MLQAEAESDTTKLSNVYLSKTSLSELHVIILLLLSCFLKNLQGNLWILMHQFTCIKNNIKSIVTKSFIWEKKPFRYRNNGISEIQEGNLIATVLLYIVYERRKKKIVNGITDFLWRSESSMILVLINNIKNKPTPGFVNVLTRSKASLSARCQTFSSQN